MKPKIILDNFNDLMNRREIKLDFEHDFVPSRIEALGVVAEVFKCDKDLIKINRVDSQFGTKVFTIVADIYNSEQDKNSIAFKKKKEIEIEKKFKEEKNKPKEISISNQKPKEVVEQNSEIKEETPRQKENSKEKSEESK